MFFNPIFIDGKYHETVFGIVDAQNVFLNTVQTYRNVDQGNDIHVFKLIQRKQISIYRCTKR